ncbi:hypothetical protein TVAG_346840 [Trichomonas vaginalis G3]|uniref:Uncharacterized protein n=1 Tax=Trichomonas vaginalis (strain ATCC PRA-98 / G3) TaxID=412133 RepID=A2FBP5_TRIV3|nr:hypothetical protein TVAGG3_0937910 [Trichomonas vaginalis G3]EAX97682.1 hypothetical protein TVAG_346840 [Trichomonas vaginalis G3]KAI5486321.1 hypothetical protein TVAGG3_0937910 [Trichomonas vaginalis G3]|eukprot:XP_001310612.1 hypothetical protein [Trichomonas vaginalis G3]
MNIKEGLKSSIEYNLEECNKSEDIIIGSCQAESFLHLKLVFEDENINAESKSSAILSFVEFKTQSAFILSSSDFIIVRILKIHSKMIIPPEETEIHELHIGEYLKISNLYASLKLIIEILPFKPYQIVPEFSWFQSILAMFLPISPPIKYYDPSFPLISFLRAVESGHKVDICKLVEDVCHDTAFLLTNFDYLMSKNIDHYEFDQQMKKDTFLKNLCQLFTQETGISHTIVYGNPFEINFEKKENHGLDKIDSDMILFITDYSMTTKTQQKYIHTSKQNYYFISFAYEVNSMSGVEIQFYNYVTTQRVHVFKEFNMINSLFVLNQMWKTNYKPKRVDMAYLYVSEHVYNSINCFRINSPFYNFNPQKIDNQTDNDNVTMFFPSEGKFLAIPSLFPVGENPKKIIIPKKLASNGFQIIYLEQHDFSYVPIVSSLNSVNQIIIDSIKNFSWYQKLVNVFFKNNNDDQLINNEFVDEINRDFFESENIQCTTENLKEIISDKLNIGENVSITDALADFALNNFRIVRIIGKQITKVFDNSNYMIPMPLDDLFILRIHMFGTSSSFFNEKSNEYITRVKFNMRHKFSNTEIIETVRFPCIYYFPKIRQKKMEIICEKQNLDMNTSKLVEDYIKKITYVPELVITKSKL